MSIEYKGKTYTPDPALGESMSPLTTRQRDKLKESLLAEGQEARIFCRPSGDPKVLYVIDGWHRLSMLIELEETPRFRKYDKALTDEGVRDIAERLQAGRRQTSDEWRLQIGREYNAQKKPVGRQKTSETAEKPQMAQSGPIKSTAEQVAEKHGVSKNTVKRSARRATAYDKLTESAKKAATNKKLSDDQVVSLAKKKAPEQNVIARDLRTGERTPAQIFPSNGKPKPAKKSAPKKPPASKAKDGKEAARRTAVSYFEYGQRALDDLQALVKSPKHAKCIKDCQAILTALQSWK